MKINGKTLNGDVDPGTPLLWALRDRLACPEPDSRQSDSTARQRLNTSSMLSATALLASDLCQPLPRSSS